MNDVLFVMCWYLIPAFFTYGALLYQMIFGEVSSAAGLVGMLVWIFCFHAWFIWSAKNSLIRAARICGFIFVVLWFWVLCVLDGQIHSLKGYHDGGEYLVAIPPILLSVIGWSLRGLLNVGRRFWKKSGRTFSSMELIANFLCVQIVSFAWIVLLDFVADNLL